MLCGKCSITLEVLKFVGRHYNSTALDTRARFSPKVRVQVGLFNWYNVHRLEFFRGQIAKQPRESSNVVQIFDVISLSSGLHASEPRDHIYGLLGISSFRESRWAIEVNYSRPIKDIYLEFSSKWIAYAVHYSRRRKEIAITSHPLFHAGVGYPRRLLASPSWIADFSTLDLAQENLRGLHNVFNTSGESFQAAGRSALHMARIDICGHVLRLRGASVTKITHTWGWRILQSLLEYMVSVTTELLRIQNVDSLTDQTEMLHSIYRTIMFDTCPNASEGRLCPGSRGYNDEFARFLWILWHRRASISDEYLLDKIKLLIDPKPSGNILLNEIGIKMENSYTESEDDYAFLIRVAALHRRRRFFHTEQGFIGSGPTLLKEGDEIFIIPGMAVPLVLRPHSQHYQLVGPCYVHGIMDGEAIGDDLDAWLASLQKIEMH